MHIHVINPNTTRSMTLKIGTAAKAAASTGVEVTTVNPDYGPASIEGYFDEAFSVPGLIEEIGKRGAGSHLRQLLQRELVVLERGDGGREKEAAYRTSPRFLQLFGLRRLEELPQLEDIGFK